MSEIIIQSIILLSVVALNYGCMKLAKMNPNIISGFKVSDEPEQRQKDLQWLSLLAKYMNIANIITLIGGFIGIFSKLQIVYFLFLILPICFAAILAYSRRGNITNQKASKSTILTTIIVAIIIIATPFIYTIKTDLEVNLSDSKIEIAGQYGQVIKIQDISEVELCQSLPEIDIKTNGFALANTCIGHFRTTEGKNVVLFTHSNNCFIRISLNNGNTFYLSHKAPQATEQLFLKIQKLSTTPPLIL